MGSQRERQQRAGGITEYAADQLGDIVFVSLPEVGDAVSAGDACGELESTKSVSDIFCPVPGVITAVNPLLEANPETINTDPYGDGWLFELELDEGADWTTYWMLIPMPNRWKLRHRSARCRFAFGPKLCITPRAFEAVHESRSNAVLYQLWTREPRGE